MRDTIVPAKLLCAVAFVLMAVSLSAQDKLGSGGGGGEQRSRGVKHFGAVGDGKADDTAAIQRAIDAGIGDVRLERGIFRISAPLVIDLDKVGYTSISGNGVARVVMTNAGPAFKFIGTHVKSADPQNFSDEVWQRQRMPLIDGVAILGEHPEADGIEATGTMQLTITRVHIRHVRHAIHLTGNNRNLVISDAHLYENRGIGVFYDEVNLHQSNLNGCHISYNGGGGVVARGGNVRNIHIAGCDIESNMSPDLPATANVLIDCSTSPHGTGEVAISGCTIQHNNPSPESANIRILGRSQPSARQALVREGNVTISGNVLSDVKTNIHLRDCRGVAITGNTFWQGYRHNLLIEDSTNIVVGPNNFDRNPRYDYGNTQDANNAVVFRNCEDCNLSALHITNVWREPAGLVIENCKRMNITGCTILDCENAGMLLKNVTLTRVSDCLIDHRATDKPWESVRVVGGKRVILTDNWLTKAPVLESAEAVLRNNEIGTPTK